MAFVRGIARAVLIVSVLALAAVPASGAVNEQQITFNSDSGNVQGWIFTNGGARQAGIVFVNEGNGVDTQTKSICRDLAEQGYVVLAPELSGFEGSTQVTDATVQQVVAAGRELAARQDVVENRVGIMGSSSGGYLAMLAAGQDRKAFRCVVAANPTIDVATLAPVVKTPTLLQHGEKDDVVLMADARHLNYEIKKNGGSSELKEYTLLGHSFWYNSEGAGHKSEVIAQTKWAWEDVSDYLSKKLQRGLSGMAEK
jgi:dienelactone hydrolase